MPKYDYYNTHTGLVEEHFRTIDDRDNVPPHLIRIVVPSKLAAGTFTAVRSTDADAAVPRAFKELEQTMSASEIVKKVGFSRDHIRRVWNFCIAFMLVASSAFGADISAGYIFQAGEKNITHAKLNSIVGDASINTSFYSSKNAVTIPSSSDTLLLNTVASGFRQITLFNALYNNTILFTSQTENTAAAADDYLLTFDTSANAYAKIQVTNLFNSVGSLFDLSALTDYTTPTNMDRLLIRDTANAANKSITLSNLVVGLPTLTATNGDYIPVWSQTNNTLGKITTDNIFVSVTNLAVFSNLFYHQPRQLVTSEMAVTADATLTNYAHGFGGTPQKVWLVLVCKTANVGYAVGDELAFTTTIADTGAGTAFSVGANATNVFAACEDNTPTIPAKDGGTAGPITASSWRLRLHAIYYP